MRLPASTALVALLVLSVTANAGAQEVDFEPRTEDEGADRGLWSDPPEYRWQWYGWRNLIPDVLAVACLVAGAAVDAPELSMAGVGVYALGSPIVHGAMGNWGRAGISLGVRLAAPATLGLVGGLASRDTRNNDFFPGWFVGAVLGVLIGAQVAAGLDIGLLARRRVPVEPDTTYAPIIQVLPGGPKIFGIAVTY